MNMRSGERQRGWAGLSSQTLLLLPSPRVVYTNHNWEAWGGNTWVCLTVIGRWQRVAPHGQTWVGLQGRRRDHMGVSIAPWRKKAGRVAFLNSRPVSCPPPLQQLLPIYPFSPGVPFSPRKGQGVTLFPRLQSHSTRCVLSLGPVHLQPSVK